MNRLTFIDGGFCCKKVNDNRICQSWLGVILNIPISVNPHNFISDKNATILIESPFGDKNHIRILLEKSKYRSCEVYNYAWPDKIEIDC